MTKQKINLNTPFPLVDKTMDKIIISLLFSAFVFIFLITFQPFDIDKITFYKPLFVLGYSFITLLVVGGSLFLLPYFFKNYFDQQKWTIKKMFIFIIFQIVMISILNWIYTVTVGEEIIVEQKNLIEFLFITLAVGILPVSYFIIFTERFFTKKSAIVAKQITEEIINNNFVESVKKQDLITLEYENSTLSFGINELVCVRSEGNYAEVYCLKNDVLTKTLIRSSLIKIMQQLENLENIQHCHRSFIVNFNHVTKVSGNARNYNLYLQYIDFSIPVSRNFPRNFINKTKK